MSELRVIGLEGIPEVTAAADLGLLVADAAARAGGLEPGDVVVVAQKVVSKAEDRVVELTNVAPSRFAHGISGGRDPRQTEAILRETARIVRLRPPLVISETRHGFVCASAGVDASNAPRPETVVLLPVDPDASAERIRGRLQELTGADTAVIVSDSFGRAWRQGTTDVAIGAAGLRVLLDLRGERDPTGYELHATAIAVADEIAGAAELVMRKLARVPAAIVRGVALQGRGTAHELVMPAGRDLFR
jgi:coenzyme F420-0:L-glutamate ligase/coenzyme F420-1:gamma-L-glutamate ligase